VQADPSRTYPDFGCSFENFTNNEFLEIETLGPLTNVLPGKTIEQVEHWSLHRDIRITKLSDDSLDQVFLPILRLGTSTK
jgi:3-methyladenine DNA glycosylase AlkC